VLNAGYGSGILRLPPEDSAVFSGESLKAGCSIYFMHFKIGLLNGRAASV
jgi:hypothetical protein